jgi:hypothetical protein
LIKQQLLISSRARRRAPNLNSIASFWVLGHCSFRQAESLSSRSS